MSVLCALGIAGLGAFCGRLVIIVLDRRYPLDVPPSTVPFGQPLAPLTYWAGPKDGETVTTIAGVALYGGIDLRGGVYRFDAARNAYTWRERRLPAADWSDLERGE